MCISDSYSLKVNPITLFHEPVRTVQCVFYRMTCSLYERKIDSFVQLHRNDRENLI